MGTMGGNDTFVLLSGVWHRVRCAANLSISAQKMSGMREKGVYTVRFTHLGKSVNARVHLGTARLS